MQHDIAGNFERAYRSGDIKSKKDILFSEIAKMITIAPSKVISLLNSCGIETKNNLSNSQIVKAVTEAIYKNQKFANCLTNEILKGNSNIKGKFIQGIGEVFGGITKNLSIKDGAQKELLLKADAINNYEVEKPAFNVSKFLGWVVVLSAIGGIIYLSVKKN